MKRSGFKPKGFAPRPTKEIAYTPRPRAAAAYDGPPTALVNAAPKFAYLRDERFRTMCRAMSCKHCGRGGDDAGVTWAHSNQGVHGHGRGIKASDQFVAAMCWVCHRELDQGKAWGQEEKVRIWNEAHLRTIEEAVALALWPAGVPLPV